MQFVRPLRYIERQEAQVTLTIDPLKGVGGFVRAAHNGHKLTNVGSNVRPVFQFRIQREPGERDSLKVWYGFPPPTPDDACYDVTFSCEHGDSYKDARIGNYAVELEIPYEFEVIS